MMPCPPEAFWIYASMIYLVKPRLFDHPAHPDSIKCFIFPWRLLDRAREALAPGGVLAFDVLGPGFWSSHPHLVLEESIAYPEARCVARQDIVCVEGEDPRLYRTWDRWFEEGLFVASRKSG